MRMRAWGSLRLRCICVHCTCNERPTVATAAAPNRMAASHQNGQARGQPGVVGPGALCLSHSTQHTVPRARVRRRCLQAGQGSLGHTRNTLQSGALLPRVWPPPHPEGDLPPRCRRRVPVRKEDEASRLDAASCACAAVEEPAACWPLLPMVASGRAMAS